ncbi:GNAT family N-acetyltransferase [Streptomyces sp. ID05-04B]|uniref:GNAT family N-acetyltransferase n=1 Tax=unclassified Streptomyces TaxID=2593676 RepID=UPI00131EFF07|nr:MULTISPECIES: GNAT family N-acetyltransferase [unclassified Streptomyces]MDX5563266.1 GNAT family N-acetyltransferase [Streptomyces sp. ID05-04B]
MDVTVLRPDELTPADLTAWRAMQAADLTLANPFLSPEFTLAVGHQRATARVARLSEGSRTVGFFPFERHALGSGKPIGSGFCDCQGLIHEPGLDWDPVELLRACDLAMWEYDHLAAGQTPFEAAGTPRARAGSPIMELNGDHSTYFEHLHRKFLKSARQKERKLTREVGPVRLVFHASESALLDTLIRWKSAQLREKGRRDLLSQESFQAILRELFDVSSESCSGTLSVLYAGEEPVAMRYQLRSSQVLAGWFPTYDTRFARYSPGILLCLKLAEAAADRGIVHIDLGKGAGTHKDDLKTAELTVTEGYVARHTPKAALCRARMASGRTAREAIRTNPAVHRAAVKAANAADRLR